MRLLVVDDDEHIRRSLATALGRAGFQVTAIEDAVPAIELAATAVFDLVVADYHMRTGTGADVVAAYKQRHAGRVFCVVLSGEEDAPLRDRCRDAGVDAMLTKPVPLAELRALLLGAATALRDAA